MEVFTIGQTPPVGMASWCQTARRPQRARRIDVCRFSSKGRGRATNRWRHGLAISRAQRFARLNLALSVAIPVFAFIWRYSLDTARAVVKGSGGSS